MSSSDVYQFPVTFSQQQLWYLNELDPESTAYNIPLAFTLKGGLDRQAMERAFAHLIGRHDALRTSFGVIDGEIKQIVHEQVEVSLPFVDLSGRGNGGDLRSLEEMKRGCALHRFDLSRPPLLFAELVKTAPDQHVLLFCVHHIIVDHVSVLQIGRELSELYAAFRNGAMPAENPESLQYPDYAVWQRESLTDEELEEKLKVWVEQLAGRSHTLELPGDRPRSKVQTFAGRELAVAFPPALSAALRAYAQEQKLSVFVVMLSALGVLLQRYTGHQDVIVGCPFANRASEELQDVVGLFMNLLPIPVDVDPAGTFSTLAAEVRRRVMRAQGLQDTPFEKIVQAVGVSRDAAQNPLVQVWFTFQDAPLALEFEGLEVDSEPLHNAGAKLDLSIWYWDGGDAVRGLIEYNSDLFDEATVQRFAKHFEQIVREVVVEKRERVDAIELLTAADRENLARWNDSSRDDVLKDMHGGFFRLAQAEPERIVLRAAEDKWTAGALARRADAIASRLVAQGAGRGSVVAVCMQRSPELVAALLGVLRSGAAYLPLDPALPAERIAYMLDDSGAHLVLTERATAGQLPSSTTEVMLVEDVVDDQPASLPDGVSGEDIAYLMYTSGSTGRPKGVLVPHRAVGNFLSAMQERPGMDREDTLLAVTTYAFDISVLEIFLPLTTGAGIFLADRSVSEDADALIHCLKTEGITVMQATPSTWRLLRAAGWEGSPDLKALIGGEALSPELADWLVPRVNQLWNMYGPTETTVWSTCERIDASNQEACPIGKPVANTVVRIVDENHQELPPGIPGELVIGGRGLSSGYLNRADLTAEKFIRLPRSGEAVYLTGDRAVWGADGQLRHLGRNDDQVKIRGYRIELGEIESVLVKLPDADTVIVKDWRISDSDHRLVAYYTSKSGAPLQAMALRKQARGFLPSYMVPQHFVHVREFPLNSSGKINRRALPAPNVQDGSAPSADHAPRDEAEIYLANVWKDLIGVQEISRNANFFEAGGHSLLAIQAISRIRDERGVTLTPRVFVLENLAEIASLVRNAASESSGGVSARSR